MVDGGPTTSGWYYAKTGASAGQLDGPLTWEQLSGLALSGGLGPSDLVWNPQLTDWVDAADVTGLFPVSGAATPTRRMARVKQPKGLPTQPSRQGRRSLLTWVWIVVPLAALAVAGTGLGLYLALRGAAETGGDGGDPPSTTTTLAGTATTPVPRAGWTQAHPDDGLPLVRAGQSMVCDHSTGRMIVFGGADDSTDFSDTWVYDPATGTWTELHPTGPVPSARSGHCMVYDPTTEKVILHGGFDGNIDLWETWEYDPATNVWTNLNPAAPVPMGRESHYMVYDPTAARVIMFGGFDGEASLNDLWAYDPATNTWSQLSPAGERPAGRSCHAMFYDPGTRTVIVFGGYDDAQSRNDTWAYDIAMNLWTELHPTGPLPAARDGHALVYDPRIGKAILFGGWDANREFADTWVYDPAANAFTELDIAGRTPSGRGLHSMADDPMTGTMLLFGGYDSGGLRNDIWAFDPAVESWTCLREGSDLPPARYAHAMAYDSGHHRVVLFGGLSGWSVGYADMWAYSPGAHAWTKLLPAGSLPVARGGHSFVLDSDTGRMIVFGGYTGSFDLDDTWAYDPYANAWTDLNPSGTLPAARDSHAAAYDPGTGTMILFGGRDDTNTPLGDTWAYDPASNTWIDLRPSGDTPPARAFHSMAYDPVSGRILLFGGSIGDSGGGQQTASKSSASATLLRYADDSIVEFDDLWAYDPAANRWTELEPRGLTPCARDCHSMAYDPATKTMVVFGGWDGYTQLSDVWAYDPAAGDWSEMITAGSAPCPRENSAMIPDSDGGGLVLFGGWDGYGGLGDTWILSRQTGTTGP